MTVAIVGGAAIGLAGSVYSANKASKSAKRAGKQAAESDAARLAFEQEKYDEWQETYGPTEDHLAEYYNTLSPTLRTVQGLEAFEKEKDIALTSMRENLAQRGIETSGISGQLENDAALYSASERARIRADAPMSVAKEQLGFLKVGLDQNPDEGMRDTLGDSQSRAQNIESITAQNAGAASGAVVDSVTGLAQAGLDKYAEYKAANPSGGS